MALFGYTGGEVQFQPYFGYTVVACERGVVRQSPDGLMVYGEQGPYEIPIQKGRTGRTAELMEMYDAVVEGRPLFHDGRWGLGTLEVCLAILESAASGADVAMKHQVAVEPLAAGSSS
jgi:predicted dehydrogenase